MAEYIHSVPPTRRAASGTQSAPAGVAAVGAPGSGSETATLLQAIQTLQQTVTDLERVIQQQTAPSSSGPTTYSPQISVVAEHYLDAVPLGENNNVGKNGTFLQFTAPAAGRAFLFFQLSTDSVVNLVVTPAGNSSSPAGAINSGNTIKANEPYMMDFPVSEGAAYQFQVATAQSAGVYASLEVQAK